MTIRKKTIAIPGSLLSKRDFQFFISDFFFLMNGSEAGKHEFMNQRTNKRINEY
jgi:hypothetical protein